MWVGSVGNFGIYVYGASSSWSRARHVLQHSMSLQGWITLLTCFFDINSIWIVSLIKYESCNYRRNWPNRVGDCAGLAGIHCIDVCKPASWEITDCHSADPSISSVLLGGCRLNQTVISSEAGYTWAAGARCQSCFFATVASPKGALLLQDIVINYPKDFIRRHITNIVLRKKIY